MGMLVDTSNETAPPCTAVLTSSISQPANCQATTLARPFKNAVIVAKKTRWDYEREKYPFLGEDELQQYLRSRGTDVEELLEKHRRQQQVIMEGIIQKLKVHNINYAMLSVKNYPDVLRNADVVISAGGDGTFLTAAAAVRGRETPVIGINTDPLGSEGHLCIGGKNPPSDIIERLASGRFRWLFRNRIRVTILNGKHKSASDTILALNDVFVGEKEAAKVSYYEVALNDEPMVKQKSSGLVVCTGTGSQAWNYSINRTETENVQNILEVMTSMGLPVPADLQAAAQQIAERVNSRLSFEPQHPNMSFTVREPIFNQTFPRTHTHGFASRLRLKSRCSDAYLVLDGTRKIPFNHGTEVLLEIREEDALRTIQLV